MDANVTPADRTAYVGRSNEVDPRALAALHRLGRYRRELPASLPRMIENARDWEHLPYVHPGSFTAIALIEEGAWGWRAKTALPDGGKQLLELLIDGSANCWTTTVVEGLGAGTRIHTQATPRENGGIAVEVEFYLPQPVPDDQGAFLLSALREQYARLYDEDDALMQGRQAALDARGAPLGDGKTADLGPVADLDPDAVLPVDLASGRFVVRRHAGEWIAHAATCPHMLGPLGQGTIDGEGRLVCPWHGYSFTLSDGAEALGRCGALPPAPPVAVRDGRLIVGHPD